MRTLLVAAGLVALGLASAEAQAPPGAPDGAQLYTRNCVSCHGATGVPNATMVRSLGAIPDLSDPRTLASVPDSAIANAIINGKGRAMRAPRTPYTPEQVRALVAHVRTLSRRP